MTKTLSALFLITLALCACSYWQRNSGKQAICNEVKHRIIFNGATGDQQTALKQRAELDNLNQTYRSNDCS